MNCGYEIKWSYDLRSYERNFCNCFNGVWTRDLAIPVRRSNQLSYEATDVGSWSFVGSNGPVRNESVMKCYMKWIIYELRIWNQVKLWSSQLWAQFLQVRRESWKIQDFNGVWTRDLAIPVRRSNQLSYEATDVTLGIRRGHGFKPRWSPEFFRLLYAIAKIALITAKIIASLDWISLSFMNRDVKNEKRCCVRLAFLTQISIITSFSMRESRSLRIFSKCGRKSGFSCQHLSMKWYLGTNSLTLS